MSVKEFIKKLLYENPYDIDDNNRLEKFAEIVLNDYLSVYTLKEKKHELISYLDIVCIEIKDNNSVIFTKKENYICTSSQENMQQIVDKLELMKCDKLTYIKLSELKKINSILGIVIFESVSSIKEAKEKGCSIVYVHNRYVNLLKDHLGVENDLSYRQELKNNKVLYKRCFLDELP